MEISFHVKGSEPEPYEVTFLKQEDRVLVLCTCTAAQYGRHCKHRMRIIAGDTTDIISDNVDQIATVQGWISGTALERTLNELTASEDSLKDIQKTVRDLKKKIARMMA